MWESVGSATVVHSRQAAEVEAVDELEEDDSEDAAFVAAGFDSEDAGAERLPGRLSVA